MSKKKPDIADIDDDRVLFVVSFYFNDEDELCCEALGDTSNRELTEAMANAMRAIAQHIEGETEAPSGQVH